MGRSVIDRWMLRGYWIESKWTHFFFDNKSIQVFSEFCDEVEFFSFTPHYDVCYMVFMLHRMSYSSENDYRSVFYLSFSRLCVAY